MMKSSVRKSSTRRKVPLLSSMSDPRVKLRKELLPRGDLKETKKKKGLKHEKGKEKLRAYRLAG
jgi:hypothetical protein